LGSVTHSAFLNGEVAGSNRWRAHRVLFFLLSLLVALLRAMPASP
jgi:hypothetical protein